MQRKEKEIVRYPVVAGSWYKGNEPDLLDEILSNYKHPVGPGALPDLKDEQKLLGIVAPHAGFACSAPIQAHAYKKLAQHYKTIDTVIILGPNHRGQGPPISIYPDGIWKTPLGDVPIDDALANKLLNLAKTSEIKSQIDFDRSAHQQEHSIEIQLPFLQQLYENFKILPISLMNQDKASMKALASLLNQLIEKSEKRIIFVCSTDLTHYDPYETTNDKDLKLIEKIKTLDIDSTAQTIKKENITACGPGGFYILMHLAKKRGYENVVLLKHATSGDTCSDKARTVGYAAISFEKSN